MIVESLYDLLVSFKILKGNNPCFGRNDREKKSKIISLVKREKTLTRGRSIIYSRLL